jgi:DNA-binding NarL/FixJ family response regulator
LKILIVDDHPLIRTGLGQILLQVEAEVEVFEAQDATEGFALADRHPELDLVLLDLGLRRSPSSAAATATFRSSSCRARPTRPR